MLEEVEQLTNWDDNPFIKLGEHVSKRYDLNYKEDHAVICILGQGASFLYKLFKKYFICQRRFITSANLWLRQ